TALDEAADEWNAKYPALRLPKKREDVPDDVSPDDSGYFYPPIIQQRLGGRGLPTFGPGFFLPPDRDPTEEDLRREAAVRWGYDWRVLHCELWFTWWPPENFAAWPLESAFHPAEQFVSACLLWNPASIDPKKWIARR